MDINIYNCICEQLTKLFINKYIETAKLKGNLLHITYTREIHLNYLYFEQKALKHKLLKNYKITNEQVDMVFKISHITHSKPF